MCVVGGRRNNMIAGYVLLEVAEVIQGQYDRRSMKRRSPLVGDRRRYVKVNMIAGCV